MNEMFKRIASLLDGQAVQNRMNWAATASSKPAEQLAKRAEPAEQDFCDTDIAVAWLCDASNKTRYSGFDEAR